MKRLKYGMVGGGIGAYIGDTHRHGAEMDGLAELKAGCFSRNREKSLETADAWNLKDLSRVYGSYQEMAEAESKRSDGIDFVSIVTPNDSHYDIAKCFLERGIHVMCDKPLTLNTAQGEVLKKIAEERDLLFGVSYGYTGYPVIRQAREMIRRGAVGDIIHIRVSHPEDWVIEAVSPEPGGALPWRFHPEQVGESLCTADLGTHAEQLLVQFTGLRPKRVLAMLDTYPAYLPLETNTTVLLDLGGGITGELWASQLAIGKICSPAIYVMGTEGSLEWDHEQPDILRYTKRGGATQLLAAGKNYMVPESNRLARVSAGHHEGFFEAFGNIYRAYCQVLLAKKEHREPENDTFPTIEDGLEGMKFIAACVKSHKNGNVWVEV